MIIDKEFKSLIPPLTAEEYQQLEKSIKTEGCRDPLVVWGEILIDGHNRYEICTKHNIPYETKNVELDSREEAKKWIIQNQTGRRNLSLYDKGLLALKLKEVLEAEAKEKEHLRKTKAITDEDFTNLGKVNSQEEAAKKLNISHGTLYKIEKIEENATPEQKQSIRDGEISINQVYEQCVNKKPPVAQRIVSSDSNEWYTPAEYIEAAREVMGDIDLDPGTCEQANKTVMAKTIFTKENDGLKHDWPGKVWLNPPYGGLTETFISRLIEQYNRRITNEAIVLLNSHATDTKWFQPLWDHTLCFTNHRINFIPPDGGNRVGSTHGSVFIYLGKQHDRFANIFHKYGVIVRRYN